MEIYTAADLFVEAVASSSPTPGGGAVAAHTGALGCALGMMAVSTTLKGKQLTAERTSRLETSLARLTPFKEALTQLTRKDATAYEDFLTAKRMPKENPARTETLQNALCNAAQIPTDTATAACQALAELENIHPDIAPIILSDIACARQLLQTSIRLAVENIRANMEYIQNPDKIQFFQQKIEEFLKYC